MPDKQVIYPKKVKMLNSLFGSAIFICLGCWIIYLGSELKSWQMIVVYLAYLVTPLFFWLFIHTLFRMIFPKPMLILDENGLLDQSSTFAVGFIPWQDIQKVFPLKVGKQQFLSIELNHRDSYLSKLKGLKLMMMKMNLQVGQPPVKLPGSHLGMSVEELGELVKQYMSQR